jgi:hypothetical protein
MVVKASSDSIDYKRRMIALFAATQIRPLHHLDNEVTFE